jgi:hypothetical protein
MARTIWRDLGCRQGAWPFVFRELTVDQCRKRCFILCIPYTHRQHPQQELLHIRDSSTLDDLGVTSTSAAAVGDVVIAEGKLGLDQGLQIRLPLPGYHRERRDNEGVKLR